MPIDDVFNKFIQAIKERIERAKEKKELNFFFSSQEAFRATFEAATTPNKEETIIIINEDLLREKVQQGFAEMESKDEEER